MSQKPAHKPTHAPQQNPRLFDHFVGSREQLVRHYEAERPGSLETNDQLKLGGCLHREVRR